MTPSTSLLEKTSQIKSVISQLYVRLEIISQHRVESPDYALVHRSRMFNFYIRCLSKSRTFYTSLVRHFLMTVEETLPLFTLHLNQLSIGSAPLELLEYF